MDGLLAWHSPEGRAFWAGVLGVLAGVALALVGWWVVRRPAPLPLTLEPPPTPEPLLVQVDGAVARPGLYALPPGARVADAVEAAGGFAPQADTQRVNMAARLEDGAWVWIPAVTETPLPVPTPPAAEAPVPPSLARININTATAAELEILPGVGPTLAQRIVAYREAHGPFASVDDLLAVKGIGPAKLEQLRPYVTVGP